MNKKLYDYLELRKTLLHFLQEDIGSGDITSENLQNSNKIISAQITYNSKYQGILCGIEEAKILLDICNCSYNNLKNDGIKILPRTRIMKITGKAKDILIAERTVLNLLMRMSGIATSTKKFVDIVKKIDPSISIASTRKTVPGMRLLDKKAVVVGGGISHRLRLDDMVMIKDNHLLVEKSITNTILSIRKKIGSSIKIECEVKNQDEAIESIHSGVDIIMLDNFSSSDVRKTILTIKNLGFRDKIIIEVSGGITLDNILSYATSKPDIISIGSLTHSSQALDFSLEVIN